LKIFRERNTDSRGEKSFVVKLILDPRHKIVYVLRGGALNWPFKLLRFRPERTWMNGLR
jgi:hypothetical protein